ncbi:magnesium ion transporter [Blastocladiella emersonii ATCC 22665]|nr:magnesium ion transporter [Blastocladiella emersonii ATCC 22665]
MATAGPARSVAGPRQFHGAPHSLSAFSGDAWSRHNGFIDPCLRTPSTAEISWRCTTIDATGSVSEAQRTYAKLAFCKQNGLQTRDLRKLDSRFQDQYPAILPRERAIVINLHHVRALIKPGRVILFNHPTMPVAVAAASGVDAVGHQAVEDDLVPALQHKLAAWSAEMSAFRAESGSGAQAPADADDAVLPFEFVVLETILQNVLATLDDELRDLARPIDVLVRLLVEGDRKYIDRQRDHLAELYVYTNRLSAFEQKVSNIRDVVRELLDTEEDMVDMHLTRHGRGETVDNYDDLELLMETYLSYAEELLDSTAAMIQQVQSTERFITLTLDSQRNALLILEIKFAMFGVACTSGALLASLFGMNLMSGLEENPEAFNVVCTLTGAICGGVLGSGIWRMSRVTRQTPAPLRQLAGSPFGLSPHAGTISPQLHMARLAAAYPHHAAATAAAADAASSAAGMSATTAATPPHPAAVSAGLRSAPPPMMPPAVAAAAASEASHSPFAKTLAPRFEFSHRLYADQKPKPT